MRTHTDLRQIKWLVVIVHIVYCLCSVLRVRVSVLLSALQLMHYVLWEWECEFSVCMYCVSVRWTYGLLYI